MTSSTSFSVLDLTDSALAGSSSLTDSALTDSALTDSAFSTGASSVFSEGVSAGAVSTGFSSGDSIGKVEIEFHEIWQIRARLKSLVYRLSLIADNHMLDD